MKILSVLHKKLIFGALSLLLITSACHSRKDSSVQEADVITSYSIHYTKLYEEVIDALYNFTPTEFKNGNTVNLENQNNGSCKLFAFAKIQKFTKEETLMCFGKFYTQDVLKNPEGDDHQNIRNFINFGWNGIEFKGEALSPK